MFFTRIPFLSVIFTSESCLHFTFGHERSYEKKYTLHACWWRVYLSVWFFFLLVFFQTNRPRQVGQVSVARVKELKDTLDGTFEIGNKVYLTTIPVQAVFKVRRICEEKGTLKFHYQMLFRSQDVSVTEWVQSVTEWLTELISPWTGEAGESKSTTCVCVCVCMSCQKPTSPLVCVYISVCVCAMYPVFSRVHVM